ncbi:unnamed protein product [Pylaiella littoralis]
MNIDIPDLLRALEVDERLDETGGKVVQGECETIFRLSKPKLSTLAKGEFLRCYVAVDLALGVLGIPFSKQTLLKKANNVKEKTYDDTYQRVRCALGGRVAPLGGKINNLAVKFPGTSIPRSLDLLRKYQAACSSTVTAEHGDRLVKWYDAPEYHAAAFCVASVDEKFKLDRKAVADVARMKPKDLDKKCADMVKKCGLSGHVAKTFRVEAPGSGDGVQTGGAGGTTGKGKRSLSPRQQGGGGAAGRGAGEGVGEGSPATASTTRLDELGAGGESPPSPDRSDRPAAGGQGTEKRLQFLEAGRAAGAPGAAADPAACLNLFVKRLRTLESKSYEEWCLNTLGAVAAD